MGPRSSVWQNDLAATPTPYESNPLLNEKSTKLDTLRSWLIIVYCAISLGVLCNIANIIVFAIFSKSRTTTMSSVSGGLLSFLSLVPKLILVTSKGYGGCCAELKPVSRIVLSVAALFAECTLLAFLVAYFFDPLGFGYDFRGCGEQACPFHFVNLIVCMALCGGAILCCIPLLGILRLSNPQTNS